MNDDHGWFLFRAYQHARAHFTDDLVRALWGNLTDEEKDVWRLIWHEASAQHAQATAAYIDRLGMVWDE